MSEYKTTQARDIASFFPSRANGNSISKKTYGHVVVVAGSNVYAGAAILASSAALKSGAGLVSLIFPKEIEIAIFSRLPPEIITHSVDTEGRGFFFEGNVASILEFCTAGKISCVAIGPGLGAASETQNFVEKLAREILIPIIIDADGLRFLDKASEHGRRTLNDREAATVLTPHPGELGRIFGTSATEVQRERSAALEKAIHDFKSVIVLKGFQTLIGSVGGIRAINSSGNAGLATAGTGDVLTGVIASLMAQGLDAARAAVAGVFIHGLAADLTKEKIGGIAGMTASDIISTLPAAIASAQSIR